MEKLIDIGGDPIAPLLDLLLKDKSTKKNIIWATDTYEELGHGFTDKEQIDRSLLLQHADIIKPRIQKSQEDQVTRTRKKAEVFTPVWLCKQMNNYCDTEWFGRENVFNKENADHSWEVTEEPIEFPKKKTWKHYVDSRRLEITCGEAPYLVSRYDVSTGERIEPTKKRIRIHFILKRIIRGSWSSSSRRRMDKWSQNRLMNRRQCIVMGTFALTLMLGRTTYIGRTSTGEDDFLPKTEHFRMESHDFLS